MGSNFSISCGLLKTVGWRLSTTLCMSYLPVRVSRQHVVMLCSMCMVVWCHCMLKLIVYTYVVLKGVHAYVHMCVGVCSCRCVQQIVQLLCRVSCCWLMLNACTFIIQYSLALSTLTCIGQNSHGTHVIGRHVPLYHLIFIWSVLSLMDSVSRCEPFRVICC